MHVSRILSSAFFLSGWFARFLINPPDTTLEISRNSRQFKEEVNKKKKNGYTLFRMVSLRDKYLNRMIFMYSLMHNNYNRYYQFFQLQIAIKKGLVYDGDG